MAIKKFKPTTPSLRWTKLCDSKELTKKRPEKSLVRPLKSSGGRNVYGRITVRYRGGAHKRLYRLIDFKRDKFNSLAKVLAIEYDPNRAAHIALVEYPDKEKRYILAPLGLKIGNEVASSRNEALDLKPGNHMLLSLIPIGMMVHNVELVAGKGGQIVRSAGAGALISAREKDFVHLRLPSGEIRLISTKCHATIGQVGNVEHSEISYGKAGRRRWLGFRPHVRGVAMNPVDHPHGGGEGKAGQGNPHPVSPWGMPTKGFKTRKKGKYSDRFIVKRRK
ncbi:MAG: 50S ribosomal protein L2 [Candidatus Omnitrophica bacterium]|nr:50S ribosomal protein L2 [Candidatus Omnitrophota bacterium]